MCIMADATEQFLEGSDAALIRELGPEDLNSMLDLKLDSELFGGRELALSGGAEEEDFHWFENRLGKLIVGAVEGECVRVVAGVRRVSFHDAVMRVALGDAETWHVQDVVRSAASRSAELWGGGLMLVTTVRQQPVIEAAQVLGLPCLQSHREDSRRFRIR